MLYLNLSLALRLSVDSSITLETCRQAVTELHNSLRKAVKLYTQVSESVCVCVHVCDREEQDKQKGNIRHEDRENQETAMIHCI